ncbi:hypothetical protein EW093_13465 [Thiospirochaeta perfilievii]|uniref:Uncharacterized protein n=1 Tax=Thiospirochaeta perfilievii TaxID=252967 RepID=A0A5C1QGI8_9SPIO|nr:capsule assembly Wzi family protein [Thiospirochaeta perfilievii]QEN05676.1 hypothetical protein EW093_13465 [Thiospirochaeta perfilievii]
MRIKTITLFVIYIWSTFIFADVGVLNFYNDIEYYNRLSLEVDHISQYKEGFIDKDNRVLLEGDSWDFKIFNPTLFYSFNSSFSTGINDGALWQGKGFNGQLETGFIFNSENIVIRLLPEIWFAQNKDFEIAPSKYLYGSVITCIDSYQRPGNETYYDINLGKSSLLFKYNIFEAELSSDNIILGPGRISPIIMSDHSEGFYHIRLGFDEWKSPIGSFEYNAFIGKLDESSFFDEDETNNSNLITAYNFAYSPVFIPGLTLGFNRSLTAPMSVVSPQIIFKIFDPFIAGGYIGEPFGYDKTDQRMSIVIDWIFPESGFKAYTEIAKNDYSTNIELLLRTPEHTLAYTIGFSKILGDFLLEFEHTDLQESREYVLGGLGGGGSFYRHHIVSQGYTNNGQLLGAGIGSGSDSQTLSLSHFLKDRTLKAYIQRIAINKDYIYGKYLDPDNRPSGSPYAVDELQFNIRLGFKGLFDFDSVSMFAEFAYDYRSAFNFIPYEKMNNIYLALGLQYKF